MLDVYKRQDYKLYQLNLDDFSQRVNENFRKNGGKEQIFYSMNRDIEKMLSVTAEVYDEKQEKYKPISCLGKGMRSIYMLSLLETCEETGDDAADLIIVENPEIFLHPRLQKVSGDILYQMCIRDRSRCFARRMRRQLEGLCEATEKIAASDLEFESRPSDIQEIGDVMMSLEKMKIALKDSLQQQWESEQQKNRQISALAHDIKTPLTVVRGNAELLAEGELKEEDQECVLEILKNVDYMEQYLDSMRQVLRGREEEEPHKMVSAEKLAYKLLEEAEAIGTAEKIPVIMGRENTDKRKDKDFSRLLEDETENTDEILCCMDEVMRAWKNILGNALEHTDPVQGIQIEIGTEKVSDNLDSFRKYLVASVRDYGSGFSDQALIYGSEPFFSGDDSRHDRKHQGLGLSIADTFMKKQGGFLKYGNSVEGDGAEVSLWIKIADEKID